MNMPRFGRSQRRGVPKQGRRNRGRGGNRPPQIRSNIQFSHKYRFVSTSATSTAITPTSILGAAGTVGITVNTNVVVICSSFKIRSLAMWTPPASQGASATCSVDWVGSANAPNVEFSDTTVSVATPAHVQCAPPAMSLAAFWQVAGAGTLFSLVAPVGTIIDLDLDLILTDDDVSATVIGVAAAALGVQYYLSLDPNATHRYTPVSLTTTT